MTLSQTAATPTPSTERVSDLVQKLVAAATAEVDAAAQRARAHAQTELTELQRTAERLRGEMQAERDRMAATLQELAVVRDSLSKLTGQLEAERRDKARLAATLETVRLLVSDAEPEPQGPLCDISEADDQLTDRAGAIEDCPEFHAGEFEADADPDAPDARLVQLLEQIEDIYRADAEDAHDTSDLIGRLAANLAYARDTFARRLESAEGPEMARFDRYVERLLEARSGTPFGRHLASALRGASPDRGALTKQAS